MRKRSLRLSQVLRPYGPGAIIDLEQESFVMLDTTINAQAATFKENTLASSRKTFGCDRIRSPPIIRIDLQEVYLCSGSQSGSSVQDVEGWYSGQEKVKLT